MTDPQFRRADETDWPAVWQVFASVVAGGDTYTYPPDIDELDARADWFHVDEQRTITYVAELDGAVVGTAILEPNLGGLGDHVAHAGWMIAPEAAGRGIGRLFAEFVLDEARRLGFVAMQFNAVVATNERALRLWRTLGFDEVGRIPQAFRHRTAGLVDLVVMHRLL